MVLLILWVVFFLIVYWTFTMAKEIEQWDPYEILGLSEVSTVDCSDSGSNCMVPWLHVT